MDYSKIKSPEKFRIEISKAMKIKSIELRIGRLKLIQARIDELIKQKRKVKLLSTEGDKRLFALYKEMLTKIDNYVEEIRKYGTLINNANDKIINPENLRVKSDYIEWHGTREELVNLIRTLLENGYIIDLPKAKILTAIKHHFCIEDFQRVVKEKQPKIKWGVSKPLLVYLFEILYKKGYLDNEFYDSRYVYISEHFVSKEGKNINNKKLRDEYDQGTKTQGASYSKAPIGYGKLEDLLKKTLTGK